MKINEDPTDIIEHIPKKDTMNEKNSVEVSGITITIEGIRLTFDQIEKAYAEAQRIKEENEINVGDWVRTPLGLSRVIALDHIGWLKTEDGYTRDPGKYKKITNPAHIQALKKIYEGMK